MLIFGIDKFMSECRARVNFYGNAVATLVIAKWDNALDLEQARRVLAAHTAPELSTTEDDEEAVDDNRADDAAPALAGPVAPINGRSLPIGVDPSTSETVSEGPDVATRTPEPAIR